MGQGAMPLVGSRGEAPLRGLGQRPNCSTGDQFQGSRQQRCRQRSVPASNFALPQKRPQAALSNIYAVSRQMGATNLLVFPIAAVLSRKQGFRLCGGDQRAFRSPFGNLRSPLPKLTFSATWGIAPAGATRVLCGRPLDPFAADTPTLLCTRRLGNLRLPC